MTQEKFLKNILPFIILAFLGSIAVPIYALISSQKESDRDLERIAHITLIDEQMKNLVSSGKTLPIPQDVTELYFGDELYAYQGVLGEKAFRQLGIKVLRDPRDDTFYNYFLKADGLSYEIMTNLEDTKYANVTLFFQKNTFAKGTSTGNFIIANDGPLAGQPIHLLTKKGQKIDLLDQTKRKKLGLFVGKSCLDILESQPGSKNGTYLIELDNTVQPVYCDMKTDGGGWTLFYANHGHETPEGVDDWSYVQMRDALQNGERFSLYKYDEPLLHGLLDYNYFIGLGAHEVLIRNHASVNDKWLAISFSDSLTLSWALGPSVLGPTDEGCIDIPDDGSWSIKNNDNTISYESLTQIMNHRGLSWGISHSNFWCNNSFSVENPHLGFYNALASEAEARARSNQGIGGQWGGENEYRYFIR